MTAVAPAAPTKKQTPYDELLRHNREASLLGSTASLLSWDEETMMPPGGLEHRSKQIAQLARMTHQMRTDQRIGDLLAACESDKSLTADPLSESAVNLRELRHDYDRSTKLPADLVEELARVTSLSRHEWAEARKASDFSRFAPWLEKIVTLSRREAECYGWAKGGEIWDALAENFEHGCTAKYVEGVFTPLRQRLAPLVAELAKASKRPDGRFNSTPLPITQQDKFSRFVAHRIGFDFNRGRLDTSTHPFCGGTHCNDTRMTTRYHEEKVTDGLSSVMHEAGHAIYNQALPYEQFGTPMGSAVGLSIHESQSRMWENQVGRSLQFWKWLHPHLSEFFGSAVGGLSVQDVYGAVNTVKPDFIRVEADEATYNLHIMVRFELERVLLSGDLKVADLPGEWNRRYKEYLGLTVPDNRRGCLQDTHWAMGALGYFPTYTLGNLYAAQFFEKALPDMPDLYHQFERGEFGHLKTWLNQKIHHHGMRYRSAKLCEVVTGKPLSADPLMRHLEGKFRPLYGL